MSASPAIKHARAVRQRLRHPRNAVADHGIDLKRKPVLTVIELALPAPDVAALPLGVGTPLPAYVLSYPAAPTVPPTLSVRTIQRTVCRHYGVSLTDLLSRRRTRAVVLPRWSRCGCAAGSRRIRCQRSAISSAIATTPPYCTPRGGSMNCARPIRRCRRSSMPSS